MADRTGLEPATSGVTGRHSNQLNYRSAAFFTYCFQATYAVTQSLTRNWWVMTGSNRRPSACKADALPAELITQLLCAVRRAEVRRIICRSHESVKGKRSDFECKNAERKHHHLIVQLSLIGKYEGSLLNPLIRKNQLPMCM